MGMSEHSGTPKLIFQTKRKNSAPFETETVTEMDCIGPSVVLHVFFVTIVVRKVISCGNCIHNFVSLSPSLLGGDGFIFYFHHYLGKIPICHIDYLIFFRWVETTNTTWDV